MQKGRKIDEEQLGRILQRIREDKGRTLDEMAEESGVSRATIHRWEKGVFPAGIPQMLTLVWTGGSTLETVEKELLGTGDGDSAGSPVQLKGDLRRLLAASRDLPPSDEGEVLFAALQLLLERVREWSGRVGGPKDVEGMLRELGPRK